MEAKERELGFIKGQKRYRIPFFQRGYVWDEFNWSDLWDELISQKKDCFLGSIIVKDDKTLSQEDITFKTVIDGQQRLTTLSILIRALNDSCSNDGEVDDDFENFLFYIKTIRDSTGKRKIRHHKIIHSEIDSVAYKKVIDGEFCGDKYKEISDNEDSLDSKILRCYKFFRIKLSNATNEEKDRIIAKLTYDTSKILVVIELNESENEQAIFDTINSAGVKLTNADIIKNALYQNLIYNNDGTVREDVLDFYKDTWINHFEKDEELLNKWLEKTTVGRIEKTNIDKFLHCFAIIKSIYDPQEDKMEDLSDKYKGYIASLTREQTKLFIRELCEYADEYRNNFLSFDALTAFSFDDGKVRLLQILSAMGVSTFDAYILNALMQYTEEQQIKEFRKLECYLMRNFVTNNTTKIKNYNKDSVLLLQGKFDFDTRLMEEDQDDVLICNALKNIRKNTKATLILFWIELYRHRASECDLNSVKLNYNFQLEHVMPQKWLEYWGVDQVVVYDDGQAVLDEERAKQIRSQKIYEIGNMTLLTSTLNARLRNYPFNDKVNGKIIGGKFKDGMKKYGVLSITAEITQKAEWDERTIEERTNKLAAEFLEIWPRKITE